MPRVYFPETQWEVQINKMTPPNNSLSVVLKFSLSTLWVIMVKTWCFMLVLFEHFGSEHITQPSLHHSIWVQHSIAYT